MKGSNPKFSFDPGFSVTKKILTLAVVFCFLIFLGLVYAGEEFDPTNPNGEHPWDELESGGDHELPGPLDRSKMMIFPWGDFGGWLIIHLPQIEDRDIEKARVKTQASTKKQGKVLILF